MDLFSNKEISPMLIASEVKPFDDPAYFYELKLDGERCLAWLDKSGTELRNKRHVLMNSKVPELTEIHRQTKVRCILDGELMVMKDGAPNFREIQRRSLMSRPFRIGLAVQQYPATFCAFDILYYDGEDVTGRPLHERKVLLQKAFDENERLARSRVVEGQGVTLFQLAKAQNLEGVVAKRRESVYQPGKRTKDWVKIKNLRDDDFVICGWTSKENGVASLALGQYRDNELKRCGHVTLGVSRAEFDVIKREPPETLVCTVKFMERSVNGGLRQPVFKGLRGDKTPQECGAT